MEILRAKECGFCMGVQRAVEIAQGCAGSNTCVLGSIIHNPKIIDELEKKGVRTALSVEDALNYSRVIIRSHGESKDVHDFFKAHDKEVIDATCPFVAKIHGIVAKHYEMGYQVVIAGDAQHSEVRGINGWCNNSAIIVDENFSFSTLSGYQKVCVVAQTTFNAQKLQQIQQKIKKECLKIVEVFDTICYTTYTRQQEAAKLAQTCTKMCVIGSSISANTRQLLDICSEFCPSYLIESVSDLAQIELSPDDKIAIIAGASAPQELVLEVYLYMVEKEGIKLENAAQQEQAVPVAEVENTAAHNDAPLSKPEQAQSQAQEPQAQQEQPSEQQEQSAPVAEQSAEEQKQAKKPKSEESSLFRAEMKKKPVNLKIGRRYRVEVLSVDEKGVFVALGNNKRDGFIPAEEASLEPFNPSDFKVGENIYAILKSSGDKATGCHILSKRDVDIENEADKAVDPIRDGSEFSLVMTSETSGGLVGNIASYRVFVPTSHIREGYPKNLSQFVGKPLRLTVLEIDDKKHKIVASQKKILEKERKEREDIFWSGIEVGKVVQGKVVRAASFGAFVEVNGFDCLAHIGDLSWNRINKVEDVLKIGESYDFVVLSAVRDTNKVALGYKQLHKHPFDEALDKYTVGSTVNGTVVRLVNFGAFVQLEKGVDALLHLSEASHSFIKNINEAFKVGDEVEAKIIKIDPEKRKISISVKAAQPEVENDEQAPKADKTKSRKAHREKTEREAGQDGSENAGEVKREERPKREFKRPVPSGERKRPAKVDPNDDGPREWSEGISNNPFADLLKEFNIDEENKES